MKYLLLLITFITLSFSNPIEMRTNSLKEQNFQMALKYAIGVEVQKDEKRAFHLFHKAARMGHLEATYLMGVSFDQGRGVKVQKTLAKYWFKLAAKQGHKQAQFRLNQLNQSTKRARYTYALR